MKIKMILDKLKSKFSTEMKAATIYTLSNLFNRGLAIITVPIFTRIMTTAEIGTVNLYNSYYGTISIVATLALTSGGFAVAMKEYEKERDQYLSSILTLTSIVAFLIGLAFAVAPEFFSGLMNIPVPLLFLMVIGFFVSPARDFWLARQRYEYKYRIPAILSIVVGIVGTIISVAAVLILKNQGSTQIAEGRLYANYALVYSVALFFFIYVFVKGKTFVNLKYWKFSLALSIPLIGHSLASQILNLADRMMIGKMIGTSEVGIYGTLYTVSSLSLMVWQSVNGSFVPYLYQNMDKPEKRKDISHITNLLIAMYGAVAVVCTFLAPEIVRILATDEYYEAIYIMPPIAAGVFYIAISNVYCNVLMYNKKTQIIMVSTSVAAICNVILNLIFIPMFGYMAAAYTTLVSYMIMAAMQMISSNTIYKKITGQKQYIYENRKLIGIAGVTTLFCISGLLFYRYTILRYAIALALAVVALVLYRKRKTGTAANKNK